MDPNQGIRPLNVLGQKQDCHYQACCYAVFQKLRSCKEAELVA